MTMDWLGLKVSDVCNLHSKATGEATMRGGLIFTEGAVSSPASFNSSTPTGASMLVIFMASAVPSVTRFTTNSADVRMLWLVSLSRFSGWLCTPTTTIGGSTPMTLKKL